MNHNSIYPINAQPVLLLTGAIAIPKPQVPYTAISRLEERLSQYLYSIDFAIDHYHSVTKIVFCENTAYAYDFSSQIAHALRCGKDLEILSFKGNDDLIQQRGKGYGEGEAIEYALNNSNLLKNCRSFYKLTGRLVIGNLDKIAASTTDENAFTWHPKEIYRRATDHVETYFFKVNRDFYTSRLLNAYREVDEVNQYFIEHIFYERLKNLNIRAFKHPLNIIGNSGTSGKPYLESRNAVILERICCTIGAHHLHKNAIEKILVSLFAQTIKIRKYFLSP